MNLLSTPIVDRNAYALTIQHELFLIALELGLIIYYLYKISKK
jgi:hypothetical protein